MKKGKYKVNVSMIINFDKRDYVIETIEVEENKIILEAIDLEYYKNKYEVKNE